MRITVDLQKSSHTKAMRLVEQMTQMGYIPVPLGKDGDKVLADIWGPMWDFGVKLTVRRLIAAANADVIEIAESEEMPEEMQTIEREHPLSPGQPPQTQ